MSGTTTKEKLGMNSKMSARLSPARGSLLVGTVLALCCYLLAAATAGAVEPAPGWRILTQAYPTNFEPGPLAPGESTPGYIVRAKNVGGEATSGEFKITDTLPADITPANAGGDVRATFGRNLQEFPCNIAGQVITCTSKQPVPAGEQLKLVIPVEVAPSATGIAINTAEVEGGGAVADSLVTETPLDGATPAFDFMPAPLGVGGVSSSIDGSEVIQAGSHPNVVDVNLTFPLKASRLIGESIRVPDSGVKGVSVDLPKGMAVSTIATPVTCSEEQLEAGNCPVASQVGTVTITVAIGGQPSYPTLGLFNMNAPRGIPSLLGFEVIEGVYIHIIGKVRSDGDYSLAANINTIPAKIGLIGAETELWGVPSEESHDEMREPCLSEGRIGSCSTERTNRAFLSTPTSCEGPLKTTLSANSWGTPNVLHEATYQTSAMSGCNALEFDPTIESQATTNLADSPSGLNFDLHVPQPQPLEQTPGRTNVCGHGIWANEATSYSYQWLRNGSPIEGATSRNYVTRTEDAGTLLQCEVAATHETSGPSRATSAATVILPAQSTPPPVPVTPTVRGFIEESGGTVTCEAEDSESDASWGGEPSFTYQWFRNGQLVPGQTDKTYTADASEAGVPLTLQCEVLGTNAGGTVAVFSGNKNGEVAPFPPYPQSIALPGTHFSEAEQPLATANLKNAKVTLPKGMTVNPSSANGLAACDSSQIGLTTPVGQASPVHFNLAPGGCPNGSKLGSVEVDTPLLENPLVGAAYLAKPFDNPFSSLLALYIAVEDEQTGIVAKLPGRIEADPNTGQLTASFVENPELPIEDVKLKFFNGARAALKTSLTCGTQTTTSVLTPWTTPEGADSTPSDSFDTSVAPGGGACPSSEAQAPNQPTFTAGTVAPTAGAYSPFKLKLSRTDGTQRLAAIDTTLPAGLTGKLAGIPYCSEAQIAAAAARARPNEGALEQQSPSCPKASEVGSVSVGAGAGPTPVYVQGHVYLAGPYKGAPLSLAIVTPAVTGPFDLGDVVVRTALYVNPETAQIHAVSDALPTILQGIPLDIRSVALSLDRPDFSLNPTSCDAMSFSGAVIAPTGQSAPLTSPFQVGGCSALGFKPNFSLKLKGGTKRGKYPALTATVTSGPGQANIKNAAVTFPHSEFLAQNHIRTVCTRVQFAASQCPARSVYGKAKAISPLLDKPLEGPVYLRSSSHELPDVVVALHGQVDVVLVGRVDSVKGQLRTTFEAAPDAPISKFILEMQGGKKGLLVNSTNICRATNRAKSLVDGQNGKTHDTAPALQVNCGGKRGKGKGKGKKHGSARLR